MRPPADAVCWTLAALAAWLYLAGLARLWGHAGVGRGVSRAQAACFAAGWIAAALPTLSGLHLLGTRVFVVHMVEHELLMIVAAPLLVLAWPLPVFAWALPRPWRRRLRRATGAPAVQATWRALTDRGVATLLHAAALWAWHLPGPFRFALASPGGHTLQHLAFMSTALLFWWTVLSREARRRPLGASAALFVTMLHSSLLGALLAFSRASWYPGDVASVPFCGLTPVEDQQLAGLVMWIPASAVYLAAALALLGPWLSGRAPAGTRLAPTSP